MFGIVAIDVLIGLITIYLVFALACTAIVEAISSWMSLRSKTLEDALKELFEGDLESGKPFVDAFYAHPMVQSLSKGLTGRPSYIPTDVVGRVIQSLLLKNDPAASLDAAIEKLPDIVLPPSVAGGAVQGTRLKELLKTFVAQGARDLQAFRKAVETHFDAVMDRASGWVKRRQQTVALTVSAVLVLCANVDTFSIATALYTTPELRAELIARAEDIVTNDPAGGAETAGAASTDPPSTQTVSTTDQALAAERQKFTEAVDAYNQARSSMAETGLQFGWKNLPTKPMDWIAKVLGLLISVFAVALGAPFWFDVLNRFMKVRQSGIAPPKKKD